MFLFQSLTLAQMGMWFAVLGSLILLNEVSRRSKWGGLACFADPARRPDHLCLRHIPPVKVPA